jgi:hypothetical protein
MEEKLYKRLVSGELITEKFSVGKFSRLKIFGGTFSGIG